MWTRWNYGLFSMFWKCESFLYLTKTELRTITGFGRRRPSVFAAYFSGASNRRFHRFRRFHQREKLSEKCEKSGCFDEFCPLNGGLNAKTAKTAETDEEGLTAEDAEHAEPRAEQKVTKGRSPEFRPEGFKYQRAASTEWFCIRFLRGS